MLGNCSVAAGLAAPQEGLSSINEDDEVDHLFFLVNDIIK
jgi:hypothetical protein